MAARLNPKNQQSVRDKIQTTQLVKRLTNHVLGKLKKPMDATQVAAALGLLKKTLPDLQSIHHAGGLNEQRGRVVSYIPDNGRDKT